MKRVINCKQLNLKESNFSSSLFSSFFLLFSFVFLTGPNGQAQSSPSGQAKFVVPSSISACNSDTICIEVMNNKGRKGVTYSGNATLEIDVPGGALVKYINNSVYSIPTGVTQLSYINNKLTVSLPLPILGATTKVCFVVVADCNITELGGLPKFNGKITYPAGFPTLMENFSSISMNVGVGNLFINPYTYYFGPTANKTLYRNQGQYSYSALYMSNTGYGDITNVKVTRTVDNALNVIPSLETWEGSNYGNPIVHGTLLSTVNDGTTTTSVFSFNSGLINSLGADNKLAAGDDVDRIISSEFTAPNQCGSWEIKYKIEWLCADGSPSCQAPQYFTDVVTIGAGTPKLDAVLNSFEQPDGCPLKHVNYTITNNGTGNAAPVGNAYDVDLNISVGNGLISISNLTLNGVPVPNSAVTPSNLQAGNFKINLKDLNTTNFGGVTDLDGDGKLDDMLVGASINVAFDYTMPCTEACGANLYNQLTSYNTFTDFCRTLVGATSTPLGDFGFQQAQPIQQVKTDLSGSTPIVPDYGVWTAPADTKTKLAKFTFQYKEHNMDLSAATAQLVINYSAKMEVNPATIKINGVAPTNAPVQMGTASYTPVYGPSDPFSGGPSYLPYSYINGATDTDSSYVITLTSAELAAMFDNTVDMLEYESTYYGCGKRQNQSNGDSWQLLVRLQPGQCSDGSAPCSFDLACKKPYSYSAGQGCDGKPCFINDMDMQRSGPIGYSNISLTSTATNPDLNNLYEGDTLQIRNGSFITDQVYMEPAGTYGYPNVNKPWRDGNFQFVMKYSKPIGWNENYSPFIFTPQGSVVRIRQYTPTAPGSTVKGTVGAVIFEAPLELGDFFGPSYEPATTQNNYNSYPYNAPTDNPVYYCGHPSYMNTVEYTGGFCSDGVQPYYYWAGSGNISRWRMINAPDNKAADFYNINIGRTLSRSGWTGNYGDANIYIEVIPRFIMNPEFPWDNSNDFSLQAGRFLHGGNADNVDHYSPLSTYFANCNYVSGTALAVTKEERVDDPKSVYGADCGLTVHHKIGYKSFSGDYFQNGEVRVPYKVTKIEINIPTEYSIVGGTLSLNTTGCNGVTNYTAISNSAPNGLVTFTNASSSPHNYSDFPRIDDCAGTGNLYSTIFDLSYDLSKTGIAAPTVYPMPIKIYTLDEFGNEIILLDTATISEASPNLTLSPIENILRPTDGGACQPSFFDFKVQNNSLFDAPYSYFAAEIGAGITSVVDITDGGNIYTDPIDPSDKTTYSGTSMFVKLGTINAGDIRIVRVFVDNSVCVGDIHVFADYGCSYPSPLQPNLSSPTLKQTTSMFEAKAPKILSKPLTSCVDIIDLCGEKEVEFEIRNADLPNLYNMTAGITLPASMTYVAGSMQIKHPVSTGSYVSVSGVTTPTSDSIFIDFGNSMPFNDPCGLVGSDTVPNNDVRIKFRFTFNSCPLTTSEEILFHILAENYCGSTSENFAVMPINYLGVTGIINNYSYTETTETIEVCVANGETQTIPDVIQINNLGGYGALSGPSSGKDSLTLAIFVDNSKFSVSNIVVPAPFGPAIVGVDAQGNPTISVKIPAGIAVGSSMNMPFTYDITAKINQVCAVMAAPANICYFGTFTRRTVLNCPSGLDCTQTLPAIITGTGASYRNFDCCCSIETSALTNIICDPNGTPSKITDNRLKFDILVTNTDLSLTTFNITVDGGTNTIPTSGTYGTPITVTLGPGTAGGGSSFNVTFTDQTDTSCTKTVTVTDPGTCAPVMQCPTPKCGNATIQVNGN